MSARATCGRPIAAPAAWRARHRASGTPERCLERSARRAFEGVAEHREARLDDVYGGDMQAEKMMLALADVSAELDAGDDADAEPLPGLVRRAHAGEGVVIGESNDGQVCGSRRGDDFLRCPRPVGGRGMHVEADAPRLRRRAAGPGGHCR